MVYNHDMSYLSYKLEQGINKLGLDVPPSKKYLDYMYLLGKWNRTYNLTSVRKPEAMLVRHIFDSLAIGPLVNGDRILDVGSGAGLPGIPLAIAYPDKFFLLVDSNGKKSRFLFQAKAELMLDNVEVAQARIEEYESDSPFDMVVCRAFASLDKVVELTKHVIKPGGQIAVMKGFYPVAELAEVKEEVTVHDLDVPGLEEQRHVVIFDLPKTETVIEEPALAESQS